MGEGKAQEGHVRPTLVGVQPQDLPDLLREPVLDSQDRTLDFPEPVAVAVLPVARDRVDEVDLRTADVVRAVPGAPRIRILHHEVEFGGKTFEGGGQDRSSRADAFGKTLLVDGDHLRIRRRPLGVDGPGGAVVVVAVHHQRPDLLTHPDVGAGSERLEAGELTRRPGRRRGRGRGRHPAAARRGEREEKEAAGEALHDA